MASPEWHLSGTQAVNPGPRPKNQTQECSCSPCPEVPWQLKSSSATRMCHRSPECTARPGPKGVSAPPQGVGSVVAPGPSSNGHSLEAKAGSGHCSPATTRSVTRVEGQRLAWSSVPEARIKELAGYSLKTHQKRHRRPWFRPDLALLKPLPVPYNLSDPQNHNSPSAVLSFQDSSNRGTGLPHTALPVCLRALLAVGADRTHPARPGSQPQKRMHLRPPEAPKSAC